MSQSSPRAKDKAPAKRPAGGAATAQAKKPPQTRPQIKPQAKTGSKAKATTTGPRKSKPVAAAAGAVGADAASAAALSAEVTALAARIEKMVRAGDGNPKLDPEAVQAMLSALCRVYSQHVEAGQLYDAFSPRNPVTPTDVMVTASGLLKAANLAVFELGMWQSWTGR